MFRLLPRLLVLALALAPTTVLAGPPAGATPVRASSWAGEAVTRTNSNDPAALRAYMRGPEFQLGAFKGEALTFRTWNQQLRQPILLAAPRILVSSPAWMFPRQATSKHG